LTIRAATPEDAAACAAIYAPYVTDSVISFEEVPPDAVIDIASVAGVAPGASPRMPTTAPAVT